MRSDRATDWSGRFSLIAGERASLLARAMTDADMIDSLSPREREVLILKSKGLSAREVGELLKITSHTVEEHTRAILKKLDVSTSIEAAVLAAKAGVL